MLNRRTLRIKAMQTAFAFKQCKEANYENALENIRQAFLPDLNSMEPQDPELLAKQGREAKEIFKSNFLDPKAEISSGSAEVINKVVTEGIDYYHSSTKKDQKFLTKQMLIEAEKIYHYYILNLLLLQEFYALAKEDKRKVHDHFISGSIIQKLEQHEEVKEIATRNNLSWTYEKKEGILRQWFKDYVKTNEEYQAFNNKESVTFEDEKELLLQLVKKVLFDTEAIESYWQEKDLSWAEDRAIVLSLLKKTIKELSDEEDEIDLQVLSYNWEDDKEFFKNLWDNTLEAADKYTDLIAEKASNWDVERLAITDRIILEMAIAEMINFPSIPVKVTINEYIEVSKRYSTPKSKQFINGMLDVISKELIKEGSIKKSGRGLIDNK